VIEGGTVKASKASEAGQMPSERLLAEMGQYNEELMKAGVLRAGEIRQAFEAEDFGAEFTPELREAEARMREKIARGRN
jgi:hypothetical protein